MQSMAGGKSQTSCGTGAAGREQPSVAKVLTSAPSKSKSGTSSTRHGPSLSVRRPVKPLSAFLRFVKEIRNTVKTGNPTANHKEVDKECSKRWKELSMGKKEEVKKSYIEDMKKYKIDLKEYRDSIVHHRNNSSADSEVPVKDVPGFRKFQSGENEAKYMEEYFAFVTSNWKRVSLQNAGLSPKEVQETLWDEWLSGNVGKPLEKRRQESSADRKKSFRCKFCPLKKFNSKSNLKVHMKMHEAPIHARRSVQCENCKEKFVKGISVMKRHVKICPGKPNIHECKDCSETFHCKSDFYEHRFKEHRKYCCILCHRKFERPSQLKKHSLVHTKKKPSFPCDICGKLLSTLKYIKFHKKFVHKINENENNNSERSHSGMNEVAINQFTNDDESSTVNQESRGVSVTFNRESDKEYNEKLQKDYAVFETQLMAAFSKLEHNFTEKELKGFARKKWESLSVEERADVVKTD